MTDILELVVWAGSNWNADIQTYCEAHGIPVTIDRSTAGRIDVMATLLLDDEITIVKVAIELKDSDLHSSLFGKGVGGVLLHEFFDVYLRLRVSGEIDGIFLFIGQIPKVDKEFYKLGSIALAQRIPYKFYLNRENAINGMFKFLESYKQVVDFTIPQYINPDAQPTFGAKMWALFPLVRGEHAKQIDTIEKQYKQGDLDANEVRDLLLDIYPETETGEDQKIYTDIVNFLLDGIEPTPLGQRGSRKVKTTKKKVK